MLGSEGMVGHAGSGLGRPARRGGGGGDRGLRLGQRASSRRGLFERYRGGVVIHGLAVNDANTRQRPGQLLPASDGGATWHQAAF